MADLKNGIILVGDLYPGDGDAGGNSRKTLKFSSEFQVLDLTEARTLIHHMIYHVKKGRTSTRPDFDFGGVTYLGPLLKVPQKL